MNKYSNNTQTIYHSACIVRVVKTTHLRNCASHKRVVISYYPISSSDDLANEGLSAGLNQWLYQLTPACMSLLYNLEDTLVVRVNKKRTKCLDAPTKIFTRFLGLR